MRLGVDAALIGDEIVKGDLTVEDGRVAEVAVSPSSGSLLAVPGFVDLQVNGFGGVDLLNAAEEGYRVAGRALAATGVTAYQPTFISSPLAAYAPALATARRMKEAERAPRVLGVHLEGPFISKRWCGAHNPDNVLVPDLEIAASLCKGGPVTSMTLAPELPGAMSLIEDLNARGVVVACGHCDADAETAHAAFDAGARAVTHIYNAHRRSQPRDPGVAGAALVRPDVVVQAIVDNVHLAPETAYAAFLAARGRFALVTDAMSAAALGPGTWRLGDREVIVSDGEARLRDGALAGSVLTMDAAVRNLVSLGASLEDAVAAATRVPATLLGRTELGTLAPRGVADIVILDDSLHVRRTLVAGEVVHAV